MSVFSAPPPHQILAPIVEIESIAPRYFSMSLQAPTIARHSQAGQFVHILAQDSTQSDPLLRRAFSILAARPELPDADELITNENSGEMGRGKMGCGRRGEIEILFRVEGAATALLSQRRVGELVDVIGPLGQPFDLSVFHVKQHQRGLPKRPLFVGGGVGVPPLIFLGDTLRSLNLSPLMLIGARRAEEIIGATRFAELHIETRIATDDGSVGLKGRVTELLETELLEIELRGDGEAVIYACGPLAMLKAVARVAAKYGVLCQVSLEENMPCGIGVCNGCVVPVKAINESQENLVGLKNPDIGNAGVERYQRVCVAGPAMWSHLVDWEAL